MPNNNSINICMKIILELVVLMKSKKVFATKNTFFLEFLLSWKKLIAPNTFRFKV